MTKITLFDRFTKNLSDEGVEINNNTVGTSALISSSLKNVDRKDGRQVHSQCSHTDFKECRKNGDELVDEKLLNTLAANRKSMRR